MKKINKENIINWLIKCYYAIIGWYKCKFVFNPKDENELIICEYFERKFHDRVIAFKYLGKKTFYRTTPAMERIYGVIYYESEKIIYPYWQVGILRFKKLNRKWKNI